MGAFMKSVGPDEIPSSPALQKIEGQRRAVMSFGLLASRARRDKSRGVFFMSIPFCTDRFLNSLDRLWRLRHELIRYTRAQRAAKQMTQLPAKKDLYAKCR